MNKKRLLSIKRELLRKLEFSEHLHKGCVRINPANSLEHELAKFLVCWEAIKSGNIVFSEVRFIGNGRADILIFNVYNGESTIVEILHTEKLSDAVNKASKYPVEVRFVKAEEMLKKIEKNLKSVFHKKKKQCCEKD